MHSFVPVVGGGKGGDRVRSPPRGSCDQSQAAAGNDAVATSPPTSMDTSPAGSCACRVENDWEARAWAATVTSRWPYGVVTVAETSAGPGLVTVVTRTLLPATHRVVPSKPRSGPSSASVTVTVTSTGWRESSWATPVTTKLPGCAYASSGTSSHTTSACWAPPPVISRRADSGSTGAVPTSVLTLIASTDRKSTRLNSSHVAISYAVFCLKKKK